jgi:dihydrofolate reductase
MRKIKLQMTISIDGFVKSQHGGDTVWDDEVTEFCITNLENVDSILLGKNTAEGFIPYWTDIAANPQADYHKLAKPLTNIPKIIFSNSLKKNEWDNATIINGELLATIKKLQSMSGKDIMVYGGHSFVSSLIRHGLIDEFYLLVYPYAAGNGEPIFRNIEKDLLLTLKNSKSFPCGIVLLSYEKRK